MSGKKRRNVGGQKRRKPKMSTTMHVVRAMDESLEDEPIGPIAAVTGLLSPAYRTGFMMLVGLGAAVWFTLFGFERFQDWVDNRALVAWSKDAMQAKDAHKAYEGQLKDHGERISQLEKQGQAQHDLLIEINTNVKNQSDSIGEMKTWMKALSKH